jgi:hypothetical protein
MANYHVLSIDAARVTMVMHIAIPTGNNLVGVSYRTALINSGRGGTSSMASDTVEGDGKISTAELTQIQAGEVYEVVRQVQIPSDLTTNTQIRDYLDSVYSQAQAGIVAELQTSLRAYGFNRNVP